MEREAPAEAQGPESRCPHSSLDALKYRDQCCVIFSLNPKPSHDLGIQLLQTRVLHTSSSPQTSHHCVK